MHPHTDLPEPALDPASHALLLRLGALSAGLPEDALTPARRRQIMRASIALHEPEEGAPAVLREPLQVPLPGRRLPARLYRPAAGQARAAGDVLLVFFHGGGWVIGDLDTHDYACAFLTRYLGCSLLSVEYRKAPEHRFPAPCEDAAEAYAWAATQAAGWDCARIAVAGDSAGAHLAAHAMYAAGEVPTAAALLFYPVTDRDFTRPSYAQRGDGPGLTRDSMRYFWEQLAGDMPIVDDARALLLRQRWERRAPPVVLSLAWHDPLHDEGLAYAQVLRAAGAQVQVQVARDMSHGFLRQIGVVPAARAHVQAALDELLVLLRPASTAAAN